MRLFEANFIFSTTDKENFPNETLPEIAFAGRSNVGKSSFINSIVLRKNLARTSQNPGKTQSINFYNIEDNFILVDLPGFGFAKASKTSRQDWQKLIYEYIQHRNNLKFVAVMIDSRIEPMERDLAFIEWLENEKKNYLIVLTKIDKISASKLNETISQWKYLTAECKYLKEILSTSAITRVGRDEFLAILKKFI